MAENKASFIIELKDFVSGGIGAISAKLAVLRQGWLAVTSVVNSAISVFQDVLNEYAAQETSINKLNSALKQQGIVSEEVTKTYVKYASELQNSTVYADEVILQNQALLVSFGLVGDELKNATQAALDLATGMNIDLRTATLLVGKASAGATETLSRYGIKISETIPQGERFAAVLDAINNRFGGAAQAQTETYAGKVLQLNNHFSDLKEELGKLMVGPATEFLSWLTSATRELNNLLSSEKAINPIYQKKRELMEENVKKQEQYVASLMSQRAINPELIAQEGARLASMRKALDILDQKIAKEEEIAAKEAEKRQNKNVADQEDIIKLQEKAQAEIDSYTLTQDQIAEKRNIALAKELEAQGQHDLSMQVLRAKRTADEKKAHDERVKNLASTLNTISTLSTSNNKALAAIGKTAAITTATMDTYAAANKALASAPPPWNFGLAALVTAAGIANVAKISGVQLAEGGMIMPSAGGTHAIMAEAGKAEVAIPLDDERTKEKLRDTLGGGNTIVIQAGTIVADEYSLSQFAQKIDEKLFELQRNGRSYR